MLKKANDVMLNLFQHPYLSTRLWTLKQVQGDIYYYGSKNHLLKRFSLVLILAFTPLSLQGAPTFSLLFSPQEVDIIRAHLEGGGDIDTIAPEVATEVIHLSAIMFMDAHNWTIWLNDQIIHTGELLDSLPFKIKNVTPYEVTFQWTPPGSSPQTFKLRTGQSFHHEKRVPQREEYHSQILERQGYENKHS